MINLVGQKFNRLLVLERAGKNRWHSILWRCKCECGTESFVTSYNLRSGRTQSCGCLCRERTGGRSKIDLTGQKVSKLTVMKDVGRGKSGHVLWQCRCECGNTHVVSSDHLRDGSIRSCGCLSKRNLIGRKFGRLKVAKLEKERSSEGRRLWYCVCDCGNKVEASTKCLTEGTTVSCGCFHRENAAKLGAQRFGPKNHNWKGGISCEPYCQDWTKEYKNYIKDRDGNACLNPDCNGKSSKLNVHHIDYVKKNCDRFNLITLCVSCNSRANADRNWHKSWYKALIYRRYSVGD